MVLKKTVLVEAVLVAAFGLALAGLANALSPRGLKLTRDYFPQDQIALAQPTANSDGRATTTNNVLSPTDLLVQRLREQGLRLAETKLVSGLFADPRRAQNLIVFVDARNEQHFKEGHIPGAYLLDNFHPYDTLAAVLPVCETAEVIVVYCHGGTCDDSLGVATLLLSAKIPPEKILVYGGGISEWTTNGLPVETGEPKSSDVGRSSR